MIGALSLSLLGFLLGVRHAVDPDHVVAVTAIAAGQPSLRRASAIGSLWGLGHSVTILLVGGAIVVFRLTVPARLALGFEFAVGVTLIVLGITNVFRNREAAPAADRARPLVVGMVHGLAGSAGVALIVLATVADPRWGIVYLIVFGAGTVLGMLLVTTAIAFPATYAIARMASARRWLVVASGAASIAFGIVLAVKLGIAGGIFSATLD